MLPSLDAQLKATINLGNVKKDGTFRFPLKRRNYDLLICATSVPRILVVYDMPDEEAHWMSVTAEQMVLKRSAYWVSLRGLKETENTDSVTVSIPALNRFDVHGLRKLMDMARSGVIDAS